MKLKQYVISKGGQSRGILSYLLDGNLVNRDLAMANGIIDLNSRISDICVALTDKHSHIIKRKWQISSVTKRRIRLYFIEDEDIKFYKEHLKTNKL